MVPSTRHPFWAERQFGSGVGTVLTLVGAWFLWRGSTAVVARTFFGCGLLLVLLGFAYPRVLVWPNRLWMRLAEALSFVSTRVVLGWSSFWRSRLRAW